LNRIRSWIRGISGGAAPTAVLLALFTGACRGQERGTGDLRALADELLPRLEVLSGLEARAPIRLETQSREAMREYVVRRLAEDMPPEELAGIQASYTAFGLIPDTLDLEALLLDLYTEQVVGYYDPETETLYVVEGTGLAEVRPVLAHELVHALQDQHMELDSLTSPERGNDRRTAAQAAIEGHATLVMFLLMLEEQAGGPVEVNRLPDMGAQLRPLLSAQNEQFPVFRSAPRVIRETLLFPYVGGAIFVQQLWRVAAPAGAGVGAPLPAPIDTLLPVSTEQVLRPMDRFFATRDEPTEIVLEEDAGAGRVLHENTLGQLETTILLGEHLGSEAEALATGWDGDRYRLVEVEGGRAIVWYTVWDSREAAEGFAAAYRRILDTRPGRHGRVDRMTIEGRPVVRVIDAERGVALEAVPVPGVVSLKEGDAA